MGRNSAAINVERLKELSKRFAVIHEKFADLYGRPVDDHKFAMEIEFKITKDELLSIKQARPWVY